MVLKFGEIFHNFRRKRSLLFQSGTVGAVPHNFFLRFVKADFAFNSVLQRNKFSCRKPGGVFWNAICCRIRFESGIVVANEKISV